MEWRTAFVGREREIASVRSLLAKTRLLTLTGPGGIGKTRLAIESVRREPGESAGELVIVELASVRDPEGLLTAIAAALGLREQGAVDPIHVLAERLGHGPTLLLLDNFEQIVVASPVVGELLDAVPALRVVVTSRVVLHLSGEQEYPVPPLELPSEDSGSSLQQIRAIEAVALFVERARTVRPDFELDASNVRTVAEICRRLDGLPLAIELAASRLKVLSPDALHRRLDQRLALLTGGAADAPERQRTLRATIAWSYELLPPRERGLMLCCAAFVGGFTIESVHAISDDEAGGEGLLDELGLLVDHNLLTASTGADGEPRFRMLETIREFAIEEMDGGAYSEVRRRHAQHFLELAEAAENRLRTQEHDRWLARLTDDLDNLRVALAWTAEDGDADRLCRLAAALATYWRYYGDIREGQRWLKEALGASRSASLMVRAKVARAAGWLEAVGGNLAEGEQLLQRALRYYQKVGDPEEMARTLYHLGSTLADLDRRTAAQRRLEQGLELARSAGGAATEGRLLWALAINAGVLGRHDDRRELVQQAIEASTRAGDMQRVALAISEAGFSAWVAGDASEAIARWAEGVALLRKLGERAFLGSFLLILGFGYVRVGELATARPLLLEGLQLMRQVGIIPDIITTVAHVTDWLLANGERERALANWHAAESIRHRYGLRESLIWPLDVVREQLGESPLTASSEMSQVSIEEALDTAERDLVASEVRVAPQPAAAKGSVFELTPREREVLELVVAGRTNAQIGEALYISRKTASVHVTNIKDKLGAGSRTEIVRMALEDAHRLEPREA